MFSINNIFCIFKVYSMRKEVILVNRSMVAMSLWLATRNGKICLAHITIYDVKITLQLVRGWLASYNNFQTTIGSFYSWIWMNLQDFMWWNLKQEAIWNYNWELLNLHLHGFCNYDFKLIRGMGKWVLCKHIYYIL